jgi:uncharacterized membrane protein
MASQHETRKPGTHRKAAKWPLLGLSGLGMALAGYLTLTAWFGAKPAFCTEGSSCDIVQGSHWGTLLGQPVAFWGFLTYAALALVVWRVRREAVQWQLAWLAALAGLAVSLYLTAISLLVIKAACGYCLASLAVMAAIVAVLALRRPEGIAGFGWGGWLLQTGGAALVLIVVLHLHYSGVFSKAAGPEDPYLRDLALHLEKAGAKFYGAYWCPVCARQKEMFGPAARRLPYIECSPGGPRTPQAGECVAAGVQSYPTWIIGGVKNTGLVPLDELARRTGFPQPGGAAK